MAAWFAKTWAAVRDFLHLDWPFLKEAFLREGLFWVAELALVLAALYVGAHLVRRRSALSRPFCRLLGHLWVSHERDHLRWQSNQRTVGPVLAGSRCECRRCGAEWNDLPSEQELRARARREAPPAAPRNRRPPAPARPPRPADPVIQQLNETMAAVDQLATVFTQTTVTRTTTTTAEKKKPATKRRQRRTRFDRDVLGDEDPVAETPPTEAAASAPAAEEPPTPEGTSSPSGPSEPEGSAPS